MSTASGHTSAITATKVIGTPVRDLPGQTIGHIKDIVLDKMSNDILFAVVGFGGFLSVGEKFHPLPWRALDYRPEDHSYVVTFTKEQLQAAPADSIEALTQGDAMMFRKAAIDYYNVPSSR